MHSSKNYAFIGDFNMNSSMKELSSSNGLKNLVKQPELIEYLQINLHNFNIVLFFRLDSLIFIYSELLDLKWFSENASFILLLIKLQKL